MNGEFISLSTAKELVDLKNRIDKALDYLQKEHIAIGEWERKNLIKILRGTKWLKNILLIYLDGNYQHPY